MPITFISKTKAPTPWISALRKLKPNLDIRIFPEDTNREKVDFALTWNHQEGAFDHYPNLKVICSMGAGVDNLMKDKNLPKGVAIVRVVDTELAIAMNEFVIALIMNHLRGLNAYKIDQQNKSWTPCSYLMIKDVRIGIMGFGKLGQSLAQALLKLDFKVSGWANSPKKMPEVNVFIGQDELPQFLLQSDILVCLLPLTDETKGILNKSIFTLLPKRAFLINVARGGHLAEEDLLEALENGHLSGASLDVFNQEPLPQDHPFWTHPKIHITPHIASITDPKSVAPQVLENYQRMKDGRALLNEVSREKGY
jgi:glyoxylate/hydroxypyruvate reductase A